MKYKVTWYNQNEIVSVESELIEAANEEEARSKAYIRYNGNPPGPMVYLEEVK